MRWPVKQPPLRSVFARADRGEHPLWASIDCAFANRKIITHLTRRVFGHLFPQAKLDLLFDVSHNSCKQQVHRFAWRERNLFVHRKGATRRLWP